MQEGENNDRNRQIYIPFNTMSDLKDTKYLDGIWFNYHGDYELIEKNLRDTLAEAHHFRPTDHNAIYVANLMTELHQFSILSLALQVLLSLVGALTLGIAGIGLMNIMLVAVQQRTREIGVEKALGAQTAAHSHAVPGRGVRHHERGRRERHHPGVHGFDRSGAHHVLQCAGQECGGRGYLPADFAGIGHRGHCDSRRDGAGERHDSRDSSGESGSDRSAAIRIGAPIIGVYVRSRSRQPGTR